MSESSTASNVPFQQAFDAVKNAMVEQPNYAWTWHCNYAVCAMDEGVSHEAANKAAARFMKLAFDVDTSGGPV